MTTTSARLFNTGIFRSNNIISLDEVSPYVIRNLFRYSEEFDNAAWSKSNTVITQNANTAPNGTLTADKLVESATTSQHLISQSVTRTNSVVYTYSIYAKVAEWTSFQLQLGNGGPRGTFDLVAQTASFDIGATAATIQAVGDGWFRCTLTGAANASAQTYVYKTSASYLGDGVSGIYIWGAQLEVGTSASSYQGIDGTGVILNPEAPSKVSITGIYSTEFDEITQTAVPMRILQNGNMQVSGSFDEVTGMIVTDGLAAYYDAGLAESQSSTGIWHDISDFGIPVDPSISPPTYDGSGYFIFDRVNTQRFQLDALNITSWTDPWTIEAWMFTSAGTTWSNGNLSHFISVGTTDGSWGLVRGSVDNRMSAWLRYGANSTSANATTFRDVWNQVVARWDPVSGFLSMYVNGEFVDSNGTSLTPTGVPDTSLMSIGGANNTLSGSPGLFYEGNIAAVILYNRALSSAEVNVNFQALRNRFGI